MSSNILGLGLASAIGLFVAAASACSASDDPCVKGLATGDHIRITVVSAVDSTPVNCRNTIGLGDGAVLTGTIRGRAESDNGNCSGFIADLDPIDGLTYAATATQPHDINLGGTYDVTSPAGCKAAVRFGVSFASYPPSLPVASVANQTPQATMGFQFDPTGTGANACPTTTECSAALAVSIAKM